MSSSIFESLIINKILINLKENDFIYIKAEVGRLSKSININDVIKKYGENTVIPDLKADIKNGELFTLLGPSGCGKTTLLRMIAGFNSIEGGTISFDENVINDIPAHKRNIGMVFQNYAIFPHMTVKENIKYGLKLRKISKEEMEKRVEEILDVVKITQYKDRLPENLSGGQQQRVALARAIVIHPDVLLMDEPLSNLDAKLRIEMRSAIRNIQKQVGITTVYVTHDQEEALAISDRIAIMKEGVIQQIDTPYNIYSRPRNVFVATFIGRSNIFDTSLISLNGKSYIEFDNGYTVNVDILCDGNLKKKTKVTVRPEEFIIGDGDEGLKGKIITATFLGKYMDYVVQLEDGMKIELSHDLSNNDKVYENGDIVYLKVNTKKINIYNEDGSKNLLISEV